MPRFTVREQDKCAVFDGSTNYLELTGFQPSNTAMSVVFWLFVQDMTSTARIFDWQDAGPANGLSINWGANNRMSAVVRNSSTAEASLTSNTVGMARWIHVAFTFATNSAKLYINNSLQGSDTAVAMTAPTVAPRIGARATGSTNFGKFYIDDLYVFNAELTAAQVETLMYRNETPSGVNSELYLKFNNNLTDSSSNARTGFTEGGTIAYSDYVRFSPRVAG